MKYQLIKYEGCPDTCPSLTAIACFLHLYSMGYMFYEKVIVTYDIKF